MAAGSSSQKNFRKAIAAIKDSTSVGIAKVNSEYKDLTVSILKATNHVEVLPKEKHVRTILGALSGSSPRADVAYCIHTLTKRLLKTHTWVVALKTLIVIHCALREVDQSFYEELIYYNRSTSHVLSSFYFNDDSSPTAMVYSTWIRAYGLYIEECLECFRVLKYDFHRDHSRTKKLDTPSLLKQLPAMQQLLSRLLNCQPTGAAQNNSIIQHAFSVVVSESVKLYVAITDGVLVLVDKFFEMEHSDAVKAVEIYRRAMQEAKGLSEFFEMCNRLDLGRGQKYASIEQPPASFLEAMEEYVKNTTSHTLVLPANDLSSMGNQNVDESDTPKLLDAPEANLATDPEQVKSEVGSQPLADPEKSNADAALVIPDLLSWDEPSPDPSQGADNDFLATPGFDDSSPSDNWELMLVAETNVSTASTEEKLVDKNTQKQKDVPNILDRSVLDSLYNTPQTMPDTNRTYHMQSASTNPFEDNTYNQIYYPQSVMKHPGSMQLATIPQQDHRLNQMAAYDCMQIAGITQPMQGASSPREQRDYQQNQAMIDYGNYMQFSGVTQPHQLTLSERPESSSFTSQDPMQMKKLPEPELSMQQQWKRKLMMTHDSSNLSGNPFEDHSFPFDKESSMAAAPQVRHDPT